MGNLAVSLLSFYSARQEAKERARIAREEAEERERERQQAEAEARERERQVARAKAKRARQELVRSNFSNDSTDETQAQDEEQRAADRRKLYLEQVEQDDIATVVTSKIRTAFLEGRDELQAYVRDQEAAFAGSPEKIAETALNAFQDYVASESPVDRLVSATSGLIVGVLQEKPAAGEPALGAPLADDSTIGDVAKNEVANVVASSLLDRMTTRLNGMIDPPADPNESETSVASRDLWRAANPRNLSKGVRTYLNNVVDKFDVFFGLATRDMGFGAPTRKPLP